MILLLRSPHRRGGVLAILFHLMLLRKPMPKYYWHRLHRIGSVYGAGARIPAFSGLTKT